MSIKLANKFLENKRYNETILRQYGRKSEAYELVPKIKDRRISSIFRAKERVVNQLALDCITTLIIYYVTFIVGWIICQNTVITHKELNKILPKSKSKYFSITFGFGSLVSSLSVNLLGRQISGALFLAIIGVTQLLSFRSEWFITFVTSLEGLSSGVLFVILIVWIIDIWRDKCWPYLQSLFFFKFFATFLEPIIQKQYISFDQNRGDFHCSTNTERNNSYLWISSNSSSRNTSLIGSNQISDVSQRISLRNTGTLGCRQNPYIMSNIPQICIGFLALCGTAFLIILYDNHKQYIEKNKIRLGPRRLLKTRVFSKRFSIESLKSWKSSFFIISISLLLSSYLTIEFSNIKLISIYWHSFDAKITVNELSFVRTVLYGSQALFGCLFILISVVLKPQIILLLNLIVISVANLTLILFSINSYTILIIVCTIMGCGFSSSPSTIYAILEQYMHIDHNIGSMIVSLSSIIYLAIREFSENLIDHKNTIFYICLNFLSVITVVLTFTLIWSSKYFINSESFTLKTPKASPENGCPQECKFDSSEDNSEYNDTFGSNGNYQPRDTSIVSI